MLRSRPLPHPRFIAFLALFASVGLAAGTFLPAVRPSVALVAGFDTGAAAFILSAVPLWRDRTERVSHVRAERDDGGQKLLLVILVATLAVVLVALGMAVQHQNGRTPADLALVVVTLTLAWVLVNLVYSFHYAHLFYEIRRHGGAAKADGGFAFPGGQPPSFADFCYFSFTIGMTCQVSDVAITDQRIRRAALIHGLVSFFFNLGVFALTVNVLAGVL